MAEPVPNGAAAATAATVQFCVASPPTVAHAACSLTSTSMAFVLGEVRVCRRFDISVHEGVWRTVPVFSGNLRARRWASRRTSKTASAPFFDTVLMVASFFRRASHACDCRTDVASPGIWRSRATSLVHPPQSPCSEEKTRWRRGS